MIVFFSTVVRAAEPHRGGEIVKLDWANKAVLARRPIYAVDPPITDTNPRGGTRGGRGILLRNGEVFVASYHTLHRLDSELREKERIANPLFANIHEIAWSGDEIWVTSTDLDAAIRVDLDGATRGSWWPREDPVTANRFELQAADIDKDADNRTRFVGVDISAPNHVHLNAVAMLDGRPLMLLNRRGGVVQLEPTRALVADAGLKGCHNLLVTRDGHILLNDTRGKAVVVFDGSGCEKRRIDLTGFDSVREMLRGLRRKRLECWLAEHGRPSKIFKRLFGSAVTSRPIFVRGLCETPSSTILVGMSPASIIEIDWITGREVDYFSYSDDSHVCVHGLACEPGCRD